MIKSRKIIYFVGVMTVVGSLAFFTETMHRNVYADPSAERIPDNALMNIPDTEDSAEKTRKNATKELAKQRQNRAVLSIENRQNVCENRRNAIENKVHALSSAATANLERLESARRKIDEYLSQNQVDGLTADSVEIMKAGRFAKDSVNDLNKISSESLNCDDNDPAKWVSIVRDNAVMTREALKSYRAELKSTVIAIQQSYNDNNSIENSTSTEANPDSVQHLNNTNE